MDRTQIPADASGQRHEGLLSLAITAAQADRAASCPSGRFGSESIPSRSQMMSSQMACSQGWSCCPRPTPCPRWPFPSSRANRLTQHKRARSDHTGAGLFLLRRFKKIAWNSSGGQRVVAFETAAHGRPEGCLRRPKGSALWNPAQSRPVKILSPDTWGWRRTQTEVPGRREGISPADASCREARQIEPQASRKAARAGDSPRRA